MKNLKHYKTTNITPFQKYNITHYELMINLYDSEKDNNFQ